MPERRILRVNELIKQEIGKIIFRDISLPKDIIVTITRVNTFSNLAQAKVYIGVIPQEKSKEVLSLLKREIFSIQQVLNKRLKMRPVPKIIFVEEKEAQKTQKIEELFEQIKRIEKNKKTDKKNNKGQVAKR